MGVPGWFSRERAESERFATAVDDEAHPDEFAEELALLGSLRQLGDSGSPDLETRQRIRAEIAAQLGPDGEVVPLRRRRRPTKAGLVAAGIAVLLALGGLTLLLSKDALPGDALYNVKLAGESTTLGLTFGDQAKAEKHLEFAAERLGELDELAKAGADSDDYVTGLGEFESQVQAGVAKLTEVATANGGQEQLSDLRVWALSQEQRLTAQQAAIPPAARSRFESAQALLDRVEARVMDLGSRLNCFRITSGSTDELGVLPANGTCDQPPASRSGTAAPETPGITPAAPSSGQASETAVTSAPTSQDFAQPTGPLPLPTGGIQPPPVIGPPIRTPSDPRPTTTTSRPPPLISLPPLLPGLPPIVIG